MMNDEIKELLEKYNRGDMKLEDQNQLESLIAEGKLDLNDFENLHGVDQYIDANLLINPGKNLDIKFYSALNAIDEPNHSKKTRQLSPWLLSSAATLLLLIGFLIGQRTSQGDSNIKTSNQFEDNAVLTMLNADATSTRLNATFQVRNLDALSGKLIDILLFNTNFDKDPNVRIASIEALALFAHIPDVRVGLIRSIQNQTSPLVIMSLAETLYNIGEKEELRKWRNGATGKLPSELLDALDKDINERYINEQG